MNILKRIIKRKPPITIGSQWRLKQEYEDDPYIKRSGSNELVVMNVRNGWVIYRYTERSQEYKQTERLFRQAFTPMETP